MKRLRPPHSLREDQIPEDAEFEMGYNVNPHDEFYSVLQDYWYDREESEREALFSGEIFRPRFI